MSEDSVTDRLLTQPLNLVDLARANYPEQYRCRHCDAVVRKVASRWLDGAGNEYCTQGRLHWGVEFRAVTPSPLLRRLG